MVNYICTRFKDTDGLDLGCSLIPKEYLLEKYPPLQEWVKAPALWVWGVNRNAGTGLPVGRLGDNSATDRSSPVQTVSGGTNWREISAGSIFSAIKTDGTLWTWGENADGQLGNNSPGNASSPVQTVSGGTNWKVTSSNRFWVSAIKTDGTLWSWGLNFNGQLGRLGTVDASSPVQTVSGGTNWKKLGSGGPVAAAIKTDGTLWLWGYGSSGALGTGSRVNWYSPVQTISAGNDWNSVKTSGYHTAAIKTDGSLWTWGRNIGGQLGNNSVIPASSPVQIVSEGTSWKQVSLSYFHSAAIKTNGTLWLWGCNSVNSGRLGDLSVIDRSSPVQTVSGGTNWRQVSTGLNSSAAIKTDGSLWTWGDNSYGQLGTSIVTDRSSPVQTIMGGSNWRMVAAGRGMTGAIRDEGDF